MTITHEQSHADIATLLEGQQTQINELRALVIRQGTDLTDLKARQVVIPEPQPPHWFRHNVLQRLSSRKLWLTVITNAGLALAALEGQLDPEVAATAAAVINAAWLLVQGAQDTRGQRPP